MPDISKVIAGLEHCRKYGTLGGNDCFGHYVWTDERDITRLEEHRHDCPYGKCITGCVVMLVDDALELLKEQEAKTPVEYEHNGYWYYICPTCEKHEELFREWNYCPFCGQKVKWE